METTIENKTIAQFIKAQQIEMQAVRTFENPHMHDGYQMDHWSCKLKIVGRGHKKPMVIPFSMGVGHKGKAPKAEDVLDCLVSDSAGLENSRSFEDWCSEYGYDTDSRKAEKTYNVCKTQADELRSFLGEDAYKELLWNTERL